MTAAPPIRNAGLRRCVAPRRRRGARFCKKVAKKCAQHLTGLAPLVEGRWELKVVIDAACQRGIVQLRALLSHVDSHLTVGQLVERLVQDGLQRYDPGRPRRGRGGGRREAGAGQPPEPKAQEGPAGGATSPAKRAAQEQPGVAPTLQGTSARGSTLAPAARSAEELARGTGGAGTSAVAALPAPPAGRETGGGSPVRAKPSATAPDTATSAAKSAADREPHATAPTPRPTPPADHSMPTALAVADRGRSAPSPAKRAGVAQLDGHSRPQPEAAGASGGSAQPPHRTRRSRYIPAPVRREVWRRDGGCCSYVDPHSGRRCGSRFLLELDHIVPFALGGSAEPGNLRLHCSAHHRFRHREYEPPPDGTT